MSNLSSTVTNSHLHIHTVALIIFFEWNGSIYLSWDTSNERVAQSLLSLIWTFFALLFAFISAMLGFQLWSQRHVEGIITEGDDIFSLSEGTPLLPIGGYDLSPSPQSKHRSGQRESGTKSKQLQLPYIPTTYTQDIACHKDDILFWIFAVFIFPLTWVICCVLPNTFMLFSPSNISYWLTHATGEGGSLLVWAYYWKWDSQHSLNVLPDVLLFYSFFAFVVMSSYLARKSLWFRIEMRRQRRLGYVPCTVPYIIMLSFSFAQCKCHFPWGMDPMVLIYSHGHTLNSLLVLYL